MVPIVSTETSAFIQFQDWKISLNIGSMLLAWVESLALGKPSAGPNAKVKTYVEANC